MKRLIAGVEAEGWRFVAVARPVPFVPFNLLNYVLGLTRIRFDQYFVASLVCMAPGAAAFTWLGFAGKEALAGQEFDSLRTAGARPAGDPGGRFCRASCDGCVRSRM